ncbi:dihydrofolate reductase family protein [Kineosporia corallincola]
MRKVVLYELVSLDGVAEAPENWFPMDDDEVYIEHLAEVIGSQDTVLLGRAMYDEWSRFWPGSDLEPFAGFINGVQKYVATSSPLTTPWTNTEATDKPADTVRQLKARSGGDIGVHGSIRLAQSLLSAGLVNELRLVIAPSLAGSGRKLFDTPDVLRRLTLQDGRRTPNGLVLLSYAVTSPASH